MITRTAHILMMRVEKVRQMLGSFLFLKNRVDLYQSVLCFSHLISLLTDKYRLGQLNVLYYHLIQDGHMRCQY
jgi:hypothetical protein